MWLLALTAAVLAASPRAVMSQEHLQDPMEWFCPAGVDVDYPFCEGTVWDDSAGQMLQDDETDECIMAWMATLCGGEIDRSSCMDDGNAEIDSRCSDYDGEYVAPDCVCTEHTCVCTPAPPPAPPPLSESEEGERQVLLDIAEQGSGFPETWAAQDEGPCRAGWDSRELAEDAILHGRPEDTSSVGWSTVQCDEEGGSINSLFMVYDFLDDMAGDVSSLALLTGLASMCVPTATAISRCMSCALKNW